jgi:hypothetical protein
MPTGLAAVALALVAVVAIGLLRLARDGRLRPAPERSFDLTSLGFVPGQPATLLHFSTPTCAPCRTVHRVCDEAAAQLDGVVALEVDAGAHLDAVRALGVWRAPTLLVVDGAGRIVLRTVGVPTLDDVLAAVRPMVAAR